MYAVIFTATVKQFTEDYVSAATQLRELAFREFGCVDLMRPPKEIRKLLYLFGNLSPIFAHGESILFIKKFNSVLGMSGIATTKCK